MVLLSSQSKTVHDTVLLTSDRNSPLRIQSYSYLSLSQSIKQSYSKIKQKQTITDTVLL